jgi:hypothetical protein
MIAEVTADKDRVWRLLGYEPLAAAVHCGSTIAEAGKGGQSLLAAQGWFVTRRYFGTRRKLRVA